MIPQRLVKHLADDREIWHPPQTHDQRRAHLDPDCQRLKRDPLGPKPASIWDGDALVCVFCDPLAEHSSGNAGEEKDRRALEILSDPEITEVSEIGPAWRARLEDDDEEVTA